jgi:hypothetical protein
MGNNSNEAQRVQRGITAEENPCQDIPHVSFLSFEPHHNALQKVMNEAYVPQDMTQQTMEHLVRRIQAIN